MGRKRIHYSKRGTAKRDDGIPSIQLGIVIGYWPCLGGPFVRVVMFTTIHELWFGLPSYRTEV